MFSLEWGFISRFPPQGLLWAPWWVPMLGVSCADQWAELSWADPSDAPLSPFFADTHSREIDHPGEPPEACISILLLATNTYSLPLLPSPEQMDCYQNRDSLKEVLSQWNCFLMSQSVWLLLEISSCLNCLQIGLMMQHRKLQIPRSFV